MEIIALERVMSILKVATNHLTTHYLIVKLTILSRSHPHYITRLALIPPFVATKVNHTYTCMLYFKRSSQVRIETPHDNLYSSIKHNIQCGTK